nr:uncharacterized protein LOC123747567 [Procambarus clarkii]
MRACTCILTIWAAAVILSCPMMVMSKHELVPYADGTMVTGCFTELTSFWACLYINLVTAIFFFVPLLLLILLYLVIGRSLMRDSASAALQHRKVDLPNMKARRQVVVMLATVTIFFFVSLLPFRVLTLWIVWTPKEIIETVGALRYYSMLYAARVMLFANSAVNPILYNLTSTKFREAFLKLLSNQRRQRFLSRQSTFNTTGNSMSNGRSSSRTIPTDLASLKDAHPVRLTLARCGRHASFDDFPMPRPNMARYGRQSSFAGSYGFPSTNSNSNSVACSRQNSRVGENGILSPLEGKKSFEAEKRHSGEGRRLLEGERASVFTGDMIEEERSSGGVTRIDSIRREQQNKIATEMEKLLSEGDINYGSALINAPSRPVGADNEGKEGCDDRPSSHLLASLSHDSVGDEKTHKENIPTLQADFATENSDPETDGIPETMKSVQFCERPSTKVSIV